MSIAWMTALTVGMVSVGTVLATAAEAGEGHHRHKFRDRYYVVEQPVVEIVRPPVYVRRPPPPPAVYRAPPVVYAPPVAYYEPVYAAPSYPSLNINIPLR